MLKALGIATAAIVASSCVDIVAIDTPRYVEQEEKRFTVSGRPEVILSTFDGAIEVRTWERPEVLVVVEKRGVDQDAARTIQVTAEQTGNRVKVTAAVPANRDRSRSFGFSTARSARLVVSVPESADVQAVSSDGSVDIERVAGRVEMRSGDGSIRGHALTGDVRAQTGDGSINLENIDGVLDANTGDGRIVARGKFSAVRARSGDGSVVVQAESGSLSAQDWDITTGDGSVTLELPEEFGAELDARTGDGRIMLTDFTLTPDGVRHGRNAVRGRLGAGGRSLRIRSGDGSITLRRY
jgi:hypothetical protein